MRGLLSGMADGESDIRRYLATFTSTLPVNIQASGGPLASRAGASRSGQPITINVYPQAGQSETEIAAMVNRRLSFAGRL